MPTKAWERLACAHIPCHAGMVRSFSSNSREALDLNSELSSCFLLIHQESDVSFPISKFLPRQSLRVRENTTSLDGFDLKNKV